MSEEADRNFKTVDVGGEIFLAVALEAQLRSRGIQVARLDPDIESPAPVFPYRLLVRAEDLPLVQEMLEELSAQDEPVDGVT